MTYVTVSQTSNSSEVVAASREGVMKDTLESAPEQQESCEFRVRRVLDVY